MFDRQMILERKQQLEQMLQEAANEYQRLMGAIQLCNAMLSELEEMGQTASIEGSTPSTPTNPSLRGESEEGETK